MRTVLLVMATVESLLVEEWCASLTFTIFLRALVDECLCLVGRAWIFFLVRCTLPPAHLFHVGS